MKPKEFADRMSKGEKFYDTVSGEIVTILEGPDITGGTHGMTDSGQIIKVNAKNLEATDEKSSDKRSDTEMLADLLKEMGINSEKVAIEPTENDKEEQEFLESYTSTLREFINHYKKIGDKYSKRYDGIKNQKGIGEQENEQMLDAIYECPTEMLEKILGVISKDDEYSKKHNSNGIVLVFSERLMRKGDYEKALELLDSEISNINFRIRGYTNYIKNTIKMREEHKISEPKKIIPETIEKATTGEVTSPNFSKAITDMTNAVKGEQEANKDENGVTQADE